MLNVVLWAVFAYLCGSIPFGLIVSKVCKNLDIREYGSKSIGATNATRVLGKAYGALVLCLDGMKAVVPIVLAQHYFHLDQAMVAMIAFFVVIGHVCPVWLRFRGGKGIACLLFASFCLNFVIGGAFLLVWLLVFFVSKISALSAIVATVVTTVFSYFISYQCCLLFAALLPIVIYRHMDNIKRMINHEELGFRQ